jgi:HSP20 family protein
MAMTKWRSPGEELTRMERQMRRLFDEPLRMNFFTEEMGWMPAIEVVDTEKTIDVTAELPGMSRNDIEIHLQNNVLTIRGEKKEEKEVKERERYVNERFYGSFQRAFTLPAPVEESRVKAEFENGVLKIHLPKTTEIRGKKISITD